MTAPTDFPDLENRVETPAQTKPGSVPQRRSEMHDWVDEQLADLIRSAETGADWAEIARLEVELIAQWKADNGQFGVGA